MRWRAVVASDATRWVLLVLGSFVLAGVALGVVWSMWATPLAVRFVDGKPATWEGLDTTFDQVAIFVLLSAGVGLVLGGVAGWLGRNRPMPTTVSVLVGSLLAGPIGYLVGRALGPGPIDLTAHSGNVVVPVPLSLRGLNPESPLFPVPDTTVLVVALTAMVALVSVLMSTAPRVHEPVSQEEVHR